MGHDIIIGNCKIYISGNFSRLDEEWGGVHTFHGHTGAVVSKIIRIVLKKAYHEGIEIPEEPNPDMNLQTKAMHDWYYGLDENGNRMPHDNFVGVFLWYMQQILKITESHPRSILRSDNVSAIQKDPLSRFEQWEILTEEIMPSHPPEIINQIVSYFRHGL